MKIFKFIFTLCLFINTQTVFSQQTSDVQPCSEGSHEYKLRYEKLKAMYIEKQGKSLTQEYIALNNSFKDKANYEGGSWEIIEQGKKGINAIHEWVRNNIEKTDFKNIEEAEAKITELINLNTKIIIENKELYTYLVETSTACDGLLFKLYIELKQELGKDFRP